jgi:glyoxylase-like metal-dependent hydrolase (beta-lactamase superfamily II)
MLVTTHGHPDHFGQGNFFPNARQFFDAFEYTGNTFIPNGLNEVLFTLVAFCHKYSFFRMIRLI